MKGRRIYLLMVIVLFISLFFICRHNLFAAVPPEAEIHNQMGNDLCNKGEFDKAVEEYQKAIELYPGFVDALYNLGVTYYNDLKNYKKAARYFSEFIHYEGTSQDAKQVRAILDIIKKEHNIVYTPKKEKEVKVEEKAKVERPISEVKSKPSKKDEIILKALEYKNRGNRYTKEGEYELAIEQYKKSLEIYPTYLDTLYNIAKVYYFELGNKEEAITYWEKFLEHEPNDSPDAKLVKTWLREARVTQKIKLEQKGEEKGQKKDREKQEEIRKEEKVAEVITEKEEKREEQEKDSERERERKMKERERELNLAGVEYESRPFSRGPLSRITIKKPKKPIKKVYQKEVKTKIKKEIVTDKGFEKIRKSEPKQEIVLTMYLPKDKRTRGIYSLVRDEIEKELILIFTQKKASNPRKLADIFKTKMQRDILPNGDEISILTLPSHLLANIERVYVLTPEDRRELEKEKWELIRSRESPARLKELLNFIREGYMIK